MNEKIKLVSEFLRRENIFHLFEYFLEVKGITRAEAENIIKAIEKGGLNEKY